MKIVIAGVGESRIQYCDERRLNKVDKLKKTKIVIGDATNIDLLREEEIERADVVIATTESDSAKKAFVRAEKRNTSKFSSRSELMPHYLQENRRILRSCEF